MGTARSTARRDSGGQAGRYRLPGASRIRKSTEIRTVLRRGKRRRTAHLDVFFAPSPASRSRLGLIVGKQGHRVVERNRLKRRLRELGRTRLLPALYDAGLAVDVLLRARREAYEASFRTLAREVEEITEMVCSHA